MISTIHKDYLQRPTIMSLPLDSALLMAKPIVKPFLPFNYTPLMTKLVVKLVKQKYGRPTRNSASQTRNV